MNAMLCRHIEYPCRHRLGYGVKWTGAWGVLGCRALPLRGCWGNCRSAPCIDIGIHINSSKHHTLMRIATCMYVNPKSDALSSHPHVCTTQLCWTKPLYYLVYTLLHCCLSVATALLKWFGPYAIYCTRSVRCSANCQALHQHSMPHLLRHLICLVSTAWHIQGGHPLSRLANHCRYSTYILLDLSSTAQTNTLCQATLGLHLVRLISLHLSHLLQELTAKYLEQFSSGVTLTLAAFRPSSKSGAAEIERITKVCSKPI